MKLAIALLILLSAVYTSHGYALRGVNYGGRDKVAYGYGGNQGDGGYNTKYGSKYGYYHGSDYGGKTGGNRGGEDNVGYGGGYVARGGGNGGHC